MQDVHYSKMVQTDDYMMYHKMQRNDIGIDCFKSKPLELCVV